MKKHAVHMPAYACICLIMLVGHGVGQARAESVPAGSLHVAALKMRSHDTAPEIGMRFYRVKAGLE